MQRIFIALPITLESTKTLIKLQKEQLNQHTTYWVPPKNFHITLAFLGKQSIDDLEPLKTKLALVEQQPIDIHFDELSQLSNDCIVLCTSQIDKRLAQLHTQIQDLCRNLLPSTPHVFKPHITLVKHEPSLAFNTIAVSPNIHIHTKEFILYSSTLAKNGVVYRSLKRFPLG